MLQFLTSWQVLMVLALLMALALGIEPATPVLIVTDATERTGDEGTNSVLWLGSSVDAGWIPGNRRARPCDSLANRACTCSRYSL